MEAKNVAMNQRKRVRKGRKELRWNVCKKEKVQGTRYGRKVAMNKAKKQAKKYQGTREESMRETNKGTRQTIMQKVARNSESYYA